MNNNKYGIIFGVLSIFLVIQLIWAADTNGIWHLAEDIRPGVFGDNEGDTATPFEYINPVEFAVTSTFDGAVIFNGVTTYQGEELDIRYINSYGEETLDGNLTVTGRVRAIDHIYLASDVRLKTNIETIQNPIETVSKLRGVTYDWKKNNQADIGFIAQEVQEILPELVIEDEDTLSMKYSGIIPLLVESIKEQQKEIDKLKLEVANLKND